LLWPSTQRRDERQNFVLIGDCDRPAGSPDARDVFGRERGMAAANPDQDNGETLYPVVANIGASLEFGGTVGTDAPISSEHLAIIRADVPTQIGWLDAIEVALCEVRRHLQDPALVEAAAMAKELRAEVTSARPHGAVAKQLWLCLYASISTPFLVYYSSTVGSDLGHATAHKIIEILSDLSHYLKL
jgi:hypothetical protein